MELVNFRIATATDLPQIVSTYNDTIDSEIVTADLAPVSVESKTDWFNKHNALSRPLWVIEYNRHYAGWVSVGSFYGRPAYDGTIELSIYIDANFRGKKVGTASLEFAINWASQSSIHTILGFIFRDNKASVSLFKKAGFQEWGCLPQVAVMLSRTNDLVIFGKKLSTLPIKN